MPETPAPPAPSEHRRRFLYGLAAAALLAAGVASVLLGLKRATLLSRMRKYNISRQFC